MPQSHERTLAAGLQRADAGIMNNSASRTVGVERRRARRYPAVRLPAVRASIVAGPEVAVIDVSPQGILLETDVRLIPGAAICLNIRVNDQTHLVGGRVARVDVALSASELRYRAGVALDETFPPFDVSAVEQAVRSVQPHTPAVTSSPRAVAPGGSPEATSEDLEVRALRQALADKRRELDHALPMIEQLTDALQANDRSRRDAEEARRTERAEWDRQRATLEGEIEAARRHEQESAEQALAAIAEERAMAARLEREHSAWAAERQALQQELDRAKALPEDAARELDTLRTARDALECALDNERATRANLLQETDRLQAELETVCAKFDALKLEGEDYRRRVAADTRQLERRLEITDIWCAEQQELIYQLAKQTLHSSALIQSWQGIERGHQPRAAHPDNSEPGATSTADGPGESSTSPLPAAPATPDASSDRAERAPRTTVAIQAQVRPR